VLRSVRRHCLHGAEVKLVRATVASSHWQEKMYITQMTQKQRIKYHMY